MNGSLINLLGTFFGNCFKIGDNVIAIISLEFEQHINISKLVKQQILDWVEITVEHAYD